VGAWLSIMFEPMSVRIYWHRYQHKPSFLLTDT
jgi:hypothetical protein